MNLGGPEMSEYRGESEFESLRKKSKTCSIWRESREQGILVLNSTRFTFRVTLELLSTCDVITAKDAPAVTSSFLVENFDRVTVTTKPASDL